MVSENEFHEILEKKGFVEQCRKLWWKHWDQYQVKFGGDKETLEIIVSAAVEKGCQAPCGS